MVAGNDDLVGVGQGTEEIVEVLYIVQGSVPGQVAGVD